MISNFCFLNRDVKDSLDIGKKITLPSESLSAISASLGREL